MTAGSIAKTEAITPRARTVANRRARAKLYDRIATGVLWAVAGFITVAFIFIVGYTVARGLPHISWQFLTSGNQEVGIGPEIYNTFYILILSLIIMIPVGVGTAIYTSEYARNQRFLSILRYATETLTSAPTLLIGIFGAVFFVRTQEIFAIGPIHLNGLGLHTTRIAGAITIAILNIPWMLRTSEDALRAVPNALREASLAAGATKWQTTFRVVLPAAIPGLITSVLITSGRVIGETAALAFTVGTVSAGLNYTNPALNLPGETLAFHAYQLFSEPTRNSENLRLGTALVLIVLVLLFNITARVLGGYINQRVSGRRA